MLSILLEFYSMHNRNTLLGQKHLYKRKVRFCLCHFPWKSRCMIESERHFITIYRGLRSICIQQFFIHARNPKLFIFGLHEDLNTINSFLRSISCTHPLASRKNILRHNCKNTCFRTITHSSILCGTTKTTTKRSIV